MTEWDVVVVGGGNTDYLVRGHKLPKPGETVEGQVFQEAAGGKGANQAVAAARLGARVLFVSRVGNDSRGSAIIEVLAREGVETCYIVRDSEAPTGVALIMVGEAGEKQILTAPGANRRATADDVLPAADQIARARVVLIQLEIPLEAVSTAIKLGSRSGAKIILDPAPPLPLPDELLPHVDVIRPNAAEAEALTGVRVNDRASARSAARRLLERKVGAVATQAGDDGNLLVWTDGEFWLPKLPVKRVDSTGAGDAFAAALAVRIAEGSSLIEAGIFANAAAALATTVLGAQASLPSRDAVQALLTQAAAKQA